MGFRGPLALTLVLEVYFSNLITFWWAFLGFNCFYLQFSCFCWILRGEDSGNYNEFRRVFFKFNGFRGILAILMVLAWKFCNLMVILVAYWTC